VNTAVKCLSLLCRDKVSIRTAVTLGGDCDTLTVNVNENLSQVLTNI
jgi:hypothetical protein